GPALAGAEAVPLPLRAGDRFLPDLDGVSDADARRANLLICGYPNNPTGAVADAAFMQRLARFGIDRGVPIAHDNAYAELTYDGYVAPSFLASPDGVEAGIEIYSLSKSLNMPGWRVAFAVGNRAMLQNLTRLKTNVDSGMFIGLQRTAVEAIALIPAFSAQMSEIYRRRRDLVCDALDGIGVRVERPRGGIYVWAPTPPGVRSEVFVDRLLDEAGVIVGAGSSYGEHGEGYMRLSLTVPDERLAEAMARIGRLYT
ncbi:MAG: aminotransferase class I/II-fold pyridoxal phosphate-dependent enzyme, partial [Gaiellales bacterium]